MTDDPLDLHTYLSQQTFVEHLADHHTATKTVTMSRGPPLAAFSPDRRKQCGQMQKIGWQCMPNGENFYILPLKLYPHDSFSPFQVTDQATNHILRVYV